MKSSARSLLLTLVLLLTAAQASEAQDISAMVNPFFDEVGTVLCSPAPGGQLDVYVVAFDLVQISGYEFQLEPSFPPAFFLGKVPYGFQPLDLGDGYEVRAGTGGCVADATMMGASPDSWTLVKYQLGYFAGVQNDMYFCLGPSPGSGAPTPQFSICDEDASVYPLYPYYIDLWGIAPDGCAVANPTQGQPCGVPTDDPSWGSLKAQY